MKIKPIYKQKVMDNNLNQQKLRDFVRNLMLQELKSKKIIKEDDEDLGVYSADFNPEEFEEIAKGASKTVKVKKHVPCTTCGGSGAKDKSSVQTCGTCGGSGQVRRVSNTFLGQMQTITTHYLMHAFY